MSQRFIDDSIVILHKLRHFQEIFKFDLSQKIFMWSPFAKMPKMTVFSCLGNRLLRCVRSVIQVVRLCRFS